MSSRGLTLLEMIIVMAIMAPISVAVLLALGQGRMTQARAQIRLAAVHGAMEDIERLRIQSGNLPNWGRIGLSSSMETTETLDLRFGGKARLTRTFLDEGPYVRVSVVVKPLQQADGFPPVELSTFLLKQDGTQP